MSRFFNTAGPCAPGKHYLLPSADRLREVVDLIAREQYFVIHAARQSGKTTLLLDQQTAMPQTLANRWIADGRIDMTGLLRGFQEFWRENADVWVDKYDYREAGPHLILMAFLQRVVNGGAHIDREFALGRRRLDLCVQMGAHRYPVELKLRYSDKSEADGLAQLGEYMDTCGANEGWLVIFDRRPDRTWDERITWRTVQCGTRTIHLVGA